MGSIYRMKGIAARTAFFGIDSNGKPGPVKRKTKTAPGKRTNRFPGAFLFMNRVNQRGLLAVQNLHEFFAGNGFLFQQISGQLMQLIHIGRKDFPGGVMGGFNDGVHLRVDLG